MPDNSNNNNNNNNNDDNNNNNQNNSNNQQDNNNQNGGGQKHIFALGMDANAQSDFANIEKIKSALEACGNTVGMTQRGPNQESYLASKSKEISADVAIFCCLVSPATIWSFRNAIKSGKLPHTIFAIEGWMAKAKSFEEVMNWPFVGEHDSDQFCNSKCQAEVKSEGNTIGEWLNAGNNQYISICYGKTPEELAENICNGNWNGGSVGGGQTTDSGGGAAIKDKTFEDCIRRICAATDSVFMVENNAAIMFPYTDWMAFTLRQKMKKISAKMIDRELYEMEYTTDGYYNKVTTVYGAKEDTTKDDDDKTPTGDSEQDKNKNKQNQNDNTTNKQTNGNVTQERKSMPTGGTLLSQQYDPLVKKYGEIEKKVTTNFPNEETALYVSNALLIQYVREFNNSCRFRMLNNQKLIGGAFYQVQDPFDKKKELYYLNSYTVGQKNKEPITTDVEFKYGPEGVENVMDYQHYSGTGGGGGTASTGEASSNEQAIWQDAAKVHYLRRDSRTCSDQNPEGAYNTIHPKLGQDDCFADCYGMSAYLYYRFNNQANIPCRVVGNSTHHVVMLFKNNAWYAPKSEYKQLEKMFGWRGDQCTDTLLEAPNNPSASASGNTGTQGNSGSNTNNGNNGNNNGSSGGSS